MSEQRLILVKAGREYRALARKMRRRGPVRRTWILPDSVPAISVDVAKLKINAFEWRPPLTSNDAQAVHLAALYSVPMSTLNIRTGMSYFLPITFS